MRKSAPVLAAAGALCICTVGAKADVIAYDVPAPSTGNQPFDGSLGMDFDVNLRVRVTQLGVFDSGQDGLSRTINAYVYNRDTATSVTGAGVPFTGAAGTLVNGSRFAPIAPVELPVGLHGSVVAENYGPEEPNGNLGVSALTPSTTDAGPGNALSYVGGGRFGTAGQFPATGDGGPANRYYAGTFRFDVVPIAYQIAGGTVGNQNYGGSLGMDFDVNTPINVTQLGVFDSAADGLQATLTAQIFARNGDGTGGAKLAELVFTPNDAGTLVDASRFKDLAAPLTLAAGSYTIVASGYGDAELNFNSSGAAGPSNLFDGEGAITFVGASRFGDANVFPVNVDGGPANRYGAGTFLFAPVPEPGAAGALALAGLGWLGCRRRR